MIKNLLHAEKVIMITVDKYHSMSYADRGQGRIDVTDRTRTADVCTPDRKGVRDNDDVTYNKLQLDVSPTTALVSQLERLVCSFV